MFTRLKEAVALTALQRAAAFSQIRRLREIQDLYPGLDQIDLGVYVTARRRFQRYMASEHQQKWERSLIFEKVKKSQPHFKSAIQVPNYVIGIDL